MKWENYQSFKARNPNLEEFLDQAVGPSGSFNEVFLLNRKKWVEERVRYVVVRPWLSLNLNSVDCPGIRYSVYFRVVHTGGDFSRARFPIVEGRHTLTVGQMLEGMPDWWENHWNYKPNFHLEYEAVVCEHTTMGEDGNSKNQAFEFFIPPEGFQP